MPLPGFLGERTGDKVPYRPGKREGELGNRFTDVLEGDLDRRGAGERRLPGEKFVAQHTHGIEIGCGQRPGPFRLFGSHIQGGAEHLAGGREASARRSARDTKIGDSDPAVGPEHQIGRLHVPVHDLAQVRHVQGLQRLGDNLQRFPNRQNSPLLMDLGEGSPVNELHHDVREPGSRAGIRLLAVVVDIDNPGMRERGKSLGFPAEPSGESRVLKMPRQQDLDRYLPVQHPGPRRSSTRPAGRASRWCTSIRRTRRRCASSASTSTGVTEWTRACSSAGAAASLRTRTGMLPTTSPPEV